MVDQVLRDEAARPPDFVHLHASTKVALQRRPWFREGYVEVPGIPVGSGTHDAQYVRRETLLGGPWEGRRRTVRYEGFTLLGWRVRSPEVGPKTSLLLEVVMQRPDDGALAPVVQAFLVDAAGTVTRRWTLQPGMGLLPVDQWRADEEFVGRYVLKVGEQALGDYTLGLFVEEAGQPLPLVRRRPSDTFHLSPTEQLYPKAVRIVTRDEMSELATADVDKTMELGEEGHCRRAETAWDDAIAHRAGSQMWRTSRRWRTHARLAWCWADRARDAAERLRTAVPEEGDVASWEAELVEAVDHVERARSWYPTEPLVRRAGADVAALCWGRAVTLEARGDLAAARRWYDRAARSNLDFAWARRRAEALRAELLQLPSQSHF
jgi:hypothetical protein